MPAAAIAPDAVDVEVLEVVGRQGAEQGRQRRAVEVGALFGMELDGQAGRLRRAEHPPHLRRRESHAFAERIDGVRQSRRRHRGDHGPADKVDIAIGVARELRRHGVGAQEGRPDRHRTVFRQAARGAQLLEFRLQIEAVAGLDLDRGDAFGDSASSRGSAWPTRSSWLAARVALIVARMPPPARAMSS